MDNGVETTISGLKAKFGVNTDTELARRLGVDKRTVSAWKIRGSVPERVQRILAGETRVALQVAPQKWDDEEKLAFAHALFRIARINGSTAQGTALEKVRAAFDQSSWQFWAMFDKAQEELAALIEQGTHRTVDEAALMLMYLVINDPESVEADKAYLRSCYSTNQEEGQTYGW